MTKEGQWYILGAIVILGLALIVWLGTLLWWIIGGVALVYAVYQGARLWGKAHKGLTKARLRKLKVQKARAEVEERRAIAEQAKAQAAALWEQRRMIPETMVGILLADPAERERVMVWPKATTNNYGLEPPAIVDADPAPLPTVFWRDVAHQIPQGQMLLGIRPDGTLRLGTWKQNKIILVLGKSSSGKTRTIAKLAAEAVRMGARLVVCDPHAAKAESLTNLIAPLAPFLLPSTFLAWKHEDILAQAQRVSALLSRRVANEPVQPSVVLVFEELNRLMRDSRIADQIAWIVQEIGQEGRGYEVYMVCGAQEVVGAGLVKLRRSFTASIIHRIDEAQAKLIIPSQQAKKAPELPPGHTFFYDDDGMTEGLRQPFMQRADLEEIARQEIGRIPKVGPMASLAGILKPGQSEAEVLQTARAAQEVSSSPSSEREGENNGLQPADIRVFLEKKKEKKIPYTEAERQEVLRLHLQEGLPASRIARAMGKDTNFYYEVKAILQAAYEAAGLDPDQEEEG